MRSSAVAKLQWRNTDNTPQSCRKEAVREQTSDDALVLDDQNVEQAKESYVKINQEARQYNEDNHLFDSIL